MPFGLAVLLAYVFAPVVERMQKIRLGRRSMPRGLAVVIFYISLVATFVVAMIWAAPRLIGEVQKLMVEAPALAERARVEWLPQLQKHLEKTISPYMAPSKQKKKAETPLAVPQGVITIKPAQDGSHSVILPAKGIVIRQEGEHAYRITVPHPVRTEDPSLSRFLARLLQYVTDNTEGYVVGGLRVAQRTLLGIVRVIFGLVITLMISAYLLLTKDSIFAFLRTLVRPEKQARFTALIRDLDAGLSGVVRGQLVICLVNGALSGIGFYLAGLDYWPILTVAATFLSIIPIFGAILSSVPAVSIALHHGMGTAVFVLAWIVGIHQIEANVLNPKIMGQTAKVHPVLVVFALLGGEHLFGIAGALFAVPVLSVVQTIFLHYRTVALVPESSQLPT